LNLIHLIQGINIWIVVLVVIIVIALFVLAELFGGRPEKPLYQYKKRECIMTAAERKCFNSLVEAVGITYYVFPQIHLPAILDHKIHNGQKWFAAFRHIDEKSVDFVLCTKNDLRPVLAIELDDWSHERQDRQERDREVERILKGAELPLLRLKDNSDIPETLVLKINSSLVQKTT
jgi:very-short-patch-repair endonuclease